MQRDLAGGYEVSKHRAIAKISAAPQMTGKLEFWLWMKKAWRIPEPKLIRKIG